MDKPMRLYLIVFTLTTFFLCVTSPCIAGTWRDAFSDDDTSEWKVHDTTLIAHDASLDLSKWQLDNNQVVGEIFGQGVATLYLTGAPSWKYYSIACRAKFVPNGTSNVAFGLVLHAQLDQEFLHQYICLIETVSNTARINRLIGDPFEDWEEKTFPFVAAVNTWYHLTATIDADGKLTFKIKEDTPNADDENEVVFTKTYPKTTEGGYAGLHVAGAKVRFDDVEIIGSNIPTRSAIGGFSVEAQGKLAEVWGELKK